MWELLFDWPALVTRGADAVTYFIMAMVGSSLFVIRLALSLFGGDAGDFDTDFHADASVHVDSDSSFNLFSLLSVLAFIMGAGWMGLACRIDWDLNRVPSLLISVGFGTAMMFLASGLMVLTRKLNRNVQYDVRTAIGRTGRVYMTIPAKGQGQGKVEVSVSGRLKVLPAVSIGEEIAAFTDVRVTDARDDDTIVVEKIA